MEFIQDDQIILSALQTVVDEIVFTVAPLEQFVDITADGSGTLHDLPEGYVLVRGVYRPSAESWGTTEISRIDYDSYQRLKANPTNAFFTEAYYIVPPNKIGFYPDTSTKTYTIRYVASPQLTMDATGIPLPAVLVEASKFRVAADLALSGYVDPRHVNPQAIEVWLARSKNFVDAYIRGVAGVEDATKLRTKMKSPYF